MYLEKHVYYAKAQIRLAVVGVTAVRDGSDGQNRLRSIDDDRKENSGELKFVQLLFAVDHLVLISVLGSFHLIGMGGYVLPF